MSKNVMPHDTYGMTAGSIDGRIIEDGKFVNQNGEFSEEQTLEIHGLAESRKDMKIAAGKMHVDEARFMVGRYYSMQKQRIAASNMIRTLSENDKPHEVAKWAYESHRRIEEDLKISLEIFAYNHPVGEWLLGVHGIGPVIASGLIAHIDIYKAPSAGHIWNFAGLNPGIEWKKGQKRPWNAELKTLLWKAGDSFVKSSNSEKAFYGRIYRDRKKVEIERNEQRMFADQAKAKLEKQNIKDKATLECLNDGRLTPGHIDMRARRAAVKMFTSHLHAVWYWIEFGVHAPVPYAIEYLAHPDYLPVPNPPWDEDEQNRVIKDANQKRGTGTPGTPGLVGVAHKERVAAKGK